MGRHIKSFKLFFLLHTAVPLNVDGKMKTETEDGKRIAAGQRLLSDAVGWTDELRAALLEGVQSAAFDFDAAAAEIRTHPAAIAAGFAPDTDACRVEFASEYFDENAVDAAAREKAEKLARMTPEERERHDRIAASLAQYRTQREEQKQKQNEEQGGVDEGKDGGGAPHVRSRVSEQIADALDMTLPPGLEALLKGGSGAQSAEIAGEAGEGTKTAATGAEASGEDGGSILTRSTAEMSQLFEQVLAIEMHKQKHAEEKAEAVAERRAERVRLAGTERKGAPAAQEASTADIVRAHAHAAEGKEDAEAPRLTVSDAFYRDTAGSHGAKSGDDEEGDAEEGKAGIGAVAAPPAAPGQHFDGGAAEAAAPEQSFDDLMDELARKDAEWQRKEGFGGENGFELPMGAGLDLSLAAAFNSTLMQQQAGQRRA